MIKTILSALVITLFCFQSLAQTKDCAIGKYWENVDENKFQSSIRPLAYVRATENVGLFCRKELSARYLKVNFARRQPLDIKSCNKIDERSQRAAKDIISLQEFVSGTVGYGDELPGDAWKWSLIPMTSARINTMLTGLYTKENCQKGKVFSDRPQDLVLRFDSNSINDAIAKVSSALESGSETACEGENNFLDIAKISEPVGGNDSLELSAEALITGMCLEMGLIMPSNNCLSSVKKILLQKPKAISYNSSEGRSSVAFMFPELFVKLLNSEKISNGLAQGAKKVLSNVISVRDKKALSMNDSLYTDLVNGFVTAGFSQAEAIDLSWDTLAVIATTGPNLYQRLTAIRIPKLGYKAAVAMSAIASMAPYLDLNGLIPSRIYSFPKEINVTCDNGKPYHFWMTAYVARQLRKQGTSEKVAAISSYISHKIYQMGASVDKRRAFSILKSTPLSPASNVVRMDLSYASAGAVYGARSTDGKINISQASSLSIDDAFKLLVKNSEYDLNANAEDTTESKLDFFKKYQTWKHRFSPDSAFDYLSK